MYMITLGDDHNHDYGNDEDKNSKGANDNTDIDRNDFHDYRCSEVCNGHAHQMQSHQMQSNEK